MADSVSLTAMFRLFINSQFSKVGVFILVHRHHTLCFIKVLGMSKEYMCVK